MNKKYAIRFNILIFLFFVGLIIILGSDNSFFADYSSNSIGATTGIRYHGVATLIFMIICASGILVQFIYFIKYLYSYIQHQYK
jgi:hypothetical protein